jgi:hypothetical protein
MILELVVPGGNFEAPPGVEIFIFASCRPKPVRCSLYVDDELISHKVKYLFEWFWVVPLPIGATHEVYVEAVDANGEIVRSESRIVLVVPPPYFNTSKFSSGPEIVVDW